MINELSRIFLETYSEYDAVILLQHIKTNKTYHLGILIGEFLETQFPYSINIKIEYADCSFLNKDYKRSYDIFERLLVMKGLSEEVSQRILFNQHFCIPHISNRYINYNHEKVISIRDREIKPFQLITFTITTCKRFHLFQQTMNSFLNCCKDLNKIDSWLCIDDNSSLEDREKMQKIYPFFTFYFKKHDEKGHPRSMNIIKKLVKTPYIFHMEDDWKFISKKKYLTNALDVMGQHQRINQCLINKNYTETEADMDVKGGEFHITNSGIRFYIQEYTNTPELITAWKNKHGKTTRNSSYWPHFSFRPSLFRTSLLEEIGDFNETIYHFEMDYAHRYTNRGYVSSFLEGINCLHIGRLTSQMRDKTIPNAYDLNNELQFNGKINPKQSMLKTYVLNLDRRLDRWETFIKSAENQLDFLKYNRCSAIDGLQLKPTEQLQRIFDGNDYNMRCGMVGCAMSHIKLYIELINSDCDMFCILEDDIEFVPEFEIKFRHVYEQLEKNPKWDLLYLGHHLYDHSITSNSYNKTKYPDIQKWDRITSLNKSIGGTGGYLISKRGALNFLEFINRVGMINCIDTMQQKSADELNIYYTEPHLIYSKCYKGNDTDIDTDIQKNYQSLTLSISERLVNELRYFENILEINDIEHAIAVSTDVSTSVVSYYKDDDINNIYLIGCKSVHPTYTLNDRVIIIVPDGNKGRYFDRLKKNNIFNIDDALNLS